MLIKAEEKAKKDADGKKNAGDAIPRQPLALMQKADDPHQNKGEADGIRGRGQQLHDRARQHFADSLPASQMHKQINCRSGGECDFFLNGFHLMLAEFAYIFPDILPKDETLFPLVQLFAELVYLAPAENDLPWQDALPPLANEVLAQGLLRCHCPAPLGADRERFFRLLAELRQRPGEHAALFVAGNSEPERQEEIISAVRRQKTDIVVAERLWQARLLLKLGEIVERQEEEIRQSLRRIALREKELLRVLRDEQPAAPLLHNATTAQPDNRRSRLLLKAWQTLLASGPLLTNIFVTADREAFAAVIEASESELRQTVSLLLPALPAGGAVAEQRSRFQQATAELRNDLPAAVNQELWEAVLEQHYPAAVHGRCRLTLHVAHSCFGLIGQNMLIGFLEQTHERD